jgi:hypothetical protein
MKSTVGVRRQCYHVTDAHANTNDHGPGQFGAMESSRLVDNGPNAFCLDNTPNHKNETGNGRDDRFEHEEMATIASPSIIFPK